MRIRMLRDTVHNGQTLLATEAWGYELPEADAEALIANGDAFAVASVAPGHEVGRIRAAQGPHVV